jgi:hypothetical protein
LLRSNDAFRACEFDLTCFFAQDALELVPADASALASVDDLEAAGALYDAAAEQAYALPDEDDL